MENPMTMSTLFGTGARSKCLRLKTIRHIYETLKFAETATPYFKSTPLSSSHAVADLFRFLAAETKRLFITIGLYPLWSLEEAIEKARTYKKMIAEDIDPRIGSQSESHITFADFVTNEFLPYAKKQYKTHHNMKVMVEKRLLKEFGSYRLSEITKRQIILFYQKPAENGPKDCVWISLQPLNLFDNLRTGS
jgi:hypothetical protein